MNRVRKYEPVDLHRFLERAFFPNQSLASDNTNIETTEWIPAVDVKEEKDRFLIKVDLPGIDKKDINIFMEDNVLTIQGERAEEKQEQGNNYYRVERVSGKFYRRFSLPETADGNEISANINKGVLDVIIAKKAPSKAKSIVIEGDE